SRSTPYPLSLHDALPIYEFPLADPRRDHTHGRIWRVVYRGEKKEVPVAKPADLSQLGAQGLVNRLTDDNLEVRRLATNELVDRRSEEHTSELQSLRHLVC